MHAKNQTREDDPFFFCWPVMLTDQALRSKVVPFFPFCHYIFTFLQIKRERFAFIYTPSWHLSKCKNRKINIVFRVNFCFLMLSFCGFLILLFLICFFSCFTLLISIDYQYITNYMVQIWFVIKPIIQTLLLNRSIYVTQFVI